MMLLSSEVFVILLKKQYKCIKSIIIAKILAVLPIVYDKSLICHLLPDVFDWYHGLCTNYSVVCDKLTTTMTTDIKLQIRFSFTLVSLRSLKDNIQY